MGGNKEERGDWSRLADHLNYLGDVEKTSRKKNSEWAPSHEHEIQLIRHTAQSE